LGRKTRKGEKGGFKKGAKKKSKKKRDERRDIKWKTTQKGKGGKSDRILDW